MFSIYNLLANPVFDDSTKASFLFETSMREEIEIQSRESVAYSNFLRESGWKHGDPLDSLPFLPIGAFKHQSLLTKVSPELKGLKLRSSGTSGLVSSVFIDTETSRRQKLSLRLTLEDFFGSERATALVLDSDPRSAEEVGARQAAIMGYIRNASDVRFLVDERDGQFVPSSSWHDLANNPPQGPVYVVGFTFVLWKFLRGQIGKTSIQLPKGSKVIHIGGWKKLESERVTSSDFNDFVSSSLGVEVQNIHDIYGFTELMGVSFIECGFGKKHVPKWVRAVTLNPRSLERQRQTEEGLLAFQSPLAHSYLGLSIVTDDVGFVDWESGKCLCGRLGQTLRVTGRRNKAEIRGCGDILGTLKFGSPDLVDEALPIRGLFPSINDFTLDQFKSEVSRLRESSKRLKAFSLPEKLEVIEALRHEWKGLADEDQTGNLRKNGVGFLVEWSNPDQLRRLLDSFLPGGRGSLDGWVSWSQLSGSRIRSTPRGLMAQWVSGNVPALGMFPIIYSWLTNNSSLSRLSSKAFQLTAELLNPLKELSFSSEAAAAISEATLAVTFDHDDEPANRLMANAADTIIAWGGEAAMSSIASLPAKRDVRRLFFGPRTSYGVVFESAIDSESRLSVVARRLVADTTVFEQAACASPHTIFVIGSDNGALEKLATAIASQFEKEASAPSAEMIGEDLLTEILLYRKRRLLDSRVISVSDYATVVMPSTAQSLPEPVFGRTLHVIQLEDPQELASFTSPYLQSVSIAGTPREAETLAEILVATGVKRFPSVGKMTNFENPWDGEDLITSLVRTSTLGGP